MSDQRPYVRVYTEIIDDPKFAGIFDDDHHLALWLRLLIAADAVWPASAYVPRAARKASLQALAQAGIVDLSSGDRYRIHGLDAERTRRSDAARVGGMASGRSRTVERPLNDRSTNAERKVNLTEPSLAEPSRADARAREGDGDYSVLLWLSEHRCGIPEGGGLHRSLIDLVARHGSERVIATMDGLGDQATAKQYIFGAANVLDAVPRPDLRAIAAKEREDEDRERHRRAVERTRRLAAEMRGEAV